MWGFNNVMIGYKLISKLWKKKKKQQKSFSDEFFRHKYSIKKIVLVT